MVTVFLKRKVVNKEVSGFASLLSQYVILWAWQLLSVLHSPTPSINIQIIRLQLRFIFHLIWSLAITVLLMYCKMKHNYNEFSILASHAQLNGLWGLQRLINPVVCWPALRVWFLSIRERSNRQLCQVVVVDKIEYESALLPSSMQNVHLKHAGFSDDPQKFTKISWDALLIKLHRLLGFVILNLRSFSRDRSKCCSSD